MTLSWSYDFFSQFQLLILNMLEMEPRNFFYLFFMKLCRSHDSGCRFNKLVHVDLNCFLVLFFYLIYIFLFHP